VVLETSMTRAVVATALMLLLSTSSALAAESPWDVLERFGLTGTWSATCGEPATVSRFHTIFSKDADGLARREIDFGVKSIYATFVDGAEMISPSMLKITVRNADPKFEKFNNKTFWTVLTKETDPQTQKAFRIRYFQSITTEGKMAVKDGINLRLGKPSPWLYKCRSAMS
jgi:hypothetical protein